MAKRGELTQEIKDLSKKLMGYEIDKTELRLMPYFQYVMVNYQKVDPEKINVQEREILHKWGAKGWIEYGSTVGCTKEFWKILMEILFVAYVDFENRVLVNA